MKRIVMIPAILSLITSQAVRAQEQGRFMSEGTCSCKISWDCLGELDSCSEEEAYRKAISMCPAGIGAVQVGELQHTDCPAATGHICDIARGEFRCGW